MSKSLAEQIRPIQVALRQDRPEVRVVVQVTAQLVGSDPGIAFAEAIDELVRWLRDDQKISAIPDSASDGTAFEVDASQGRPVSVEAIEGLWGMRYDNPDLTVAGRNWRTEAIVGRTDDAALVGIRLTVITPEWGVPYFRSVPRAVSRLVAAPGLTEYGFRLLDCPWAVEGGEEVARLVNLLQEPSRSRPVILVSPVQSGGWLVDPQRLSMRLAGLAHVVKISADAAWQLSEVVGRRLSVFGGAVRTYQPGFDFGQSRFEEHPVATPAWVESRFGSGSRFQEILIKQTIESSASAPDLERRLPSFASFRRALAKKRLSEARQRAAPDTELLALYETDNARLAEDASAAEQLAVEAEEKYQNSEQEKELLRTEIYGLKQRVEHLISKLAETGRAEKIDIPTSLEAVEEWVAKYFSSRIFLMPRAIRGARKSYYEDTAGVYVALQLLGGEYWRNRRGELSSQDLEQKCAQLGVAITSTGDRTRLMQWREQYEVLWKSERQFLDIHLKKGKAADPRLTLRIYFFWDPNEELVVIGHMTDHLRSSHS